MNLDIKIPLFAPPMKPVEHDDYPISPRENLLRAFRHEKPMWMPMLNPSTQWCFPPAYRDLPASNPVACVTNTEMPTDWFGTKYDYAPDVGPTPVGGIFDEICEWREKMKFPDLDKVNWMEGLENFVRDPSLALATRLGSSCFERLHSSEGFEQCLVDILVEPEECKAFFDRVADYRIDSFRRMNDLFHFDFVVNHDDWSNAKSAFFSPTTFEETLLESAIRISDAIHEAGCLYMAHCCGKMDAFVPYFANEIHADALEIQSINDIRAILDRYGDKLTPMFTPDPYVMYDPATTPEQARAYAREIVDQYGAQTCEGAGVLLKLHGDQPASYYAFEDEIFHYSMEKYAALQ